MPVERRQGENAQRRTTGRNSRSKLKLPRWYIASLVSASVLAVIAPAFPLPWEAIIAAASSQLYGISTIFYAQSRRGADE
jgi:hypothetical protein